jgi:polysaccharide export outer membrane protein
MDMHFAVSTTPMRRFAAWLGASFMALGLACSSASAAYLLGPGDKLVVTVYGAPDLERRTAVNADGQIIMPLIGSVPVAGLSIDDAKQLIQKLLAEKNIVKVPDVSIDITDHRPFYATGDLSRPGSYAYQPGLTVRQAVVLAGGYDLVRFHFGQNPFIQAAELRSDYQTLSTDLAREQLKQVRLQAELAGKTDADFGKFADIPISQKTFEDLASIERRSLKERMDNAAREQASLQRVVDFSKAQVSALDASIAGESDNIKQQLEDTDKFKTLSEKGLITSNRVLDEQRSLNLARTRLQDNQARAALARRELENAQRAVDRFVEQRRSDLTTQLSETLANIERIKNRVEASAEKFAILGTGSSAILMAGGDGPEVTVFRAENGKQVTIRGDLDTAIEPGDVVQVQLKASKLLGMAVDK